MNALLLVIWVSLALLYVLHPRTGITVYLIALPLFPFYWAPLFLVPFNALTIQRTVAFGLLLGLVLETSREVHNRSLNLHRTGVELLLVAMIILWSLSAFETVTFSSGLRRMMFNLLDFWVPFVLGLRVMLRTNISNRVVIRFLFAWVAWPALGVAVLTLVEYIAQTPLAWQWFSSLHSSLADEIWAPTSRASVLRVQATLGQSIFLGGYLTCAAIIAMILGTGMRGIKRLFAYAAGMFMLLCSFLPMARGAIIAAVLSLTLMTLLVRGRLRLVLLSEIGMTIGLLWIVADYFSDTASFWTDFALTLVGRVPLSVQAEQLNNYEVRIDILNTGLALIGRAPWLGYGDPSVNGTWPIPDVANVFIEVGLTSGPVGLALFIIFILLIGIALVKIWRMEHQGEHYLLVNGLFGITVVVLLIWFNSSWPGQLTQVGWLFFGAIGGWTLCGKRKSLVEQNIKGRRSLHTIGSRVRLIHYSGESGE